MKQVDCFGLHFEGEFAFLHEQDRELCLNEGFGALPSPFEVRRRDRERCPHDLIGLIDEPDVEGPDHPLVRAMAPIPSTEAFYVPREAAAIVEELTRLSSLTPLGVFAPWANPVRSLVSRLTTSNIGPIIIVSYEMRHMNDISRLLALPRRRPIILCGGWQPPRTTFISTDGLDALRPELPWRAIGLTILRSWIAARCSDLTRSPTSAS